MVKEMCLNYKTYEHYENIIRATKSSLISMLLRKSENLNFVGFYGFYGIVLVKFNLTGHWLSITYSKNKQYNGTELNLLYLTGSLPTSIETVIPKCKKIEITCESHDQGWSSYPEHYGACYLSTWGEVSIITTTHNYDDKFIVHNAVEKGTENTI
ncbi:7008_t:CDS:2 [Gigaspora margarita]|uniref:7008_t:CDS:1 n=1 Tax=Gigaspora margarita TaxID=4874 RepID=A0ABM8W517_GIGMA|nr:7008_t:CDS:2 [Gigaspora margarita]